MGFAGSVLRATGGDRDYNVKTLVKDPQLQALLDSYRSGLGSTLSQNNADISKYLEQYNANTPAAIDRSKQEAGAIDRYYNGGVEGDLGNLRAQETAARKQGLKLAEDYMTKRQNLASLNRGLGLGSYNSQMNLAEDRKMNTENLLADAANSRRDYESLQNAKLSLAGRRDAVMDSALSRYLQGTQLRNANAASGLGLLGGFSQADKSNKFIGINSPRKWWDKWADITDAFDQSIVNAAGMYSSMGGGMGGMGGGGAGGAGKAEGGDVSAGMNYTVGERGPEVFVPDNYGGGGGGSLTEGVGMSYDVPIDEPYQPPGMRYDLERPYTRSVPGMSYDNPSQSRPYLLGQGGQHQFTPNQNGTVINNKDVQNILDKMLNSLMSGGGGQHSQVMSGDTEKPTVDNKMGTVIGSIGRQTQTWQG